MSRYARQTTGEVLKISPWHRILDDGSTECHITNYTSRPRIETTDEVPLRAMTCPKCLYHGIQLQSGRNVIEPPAAVYQTREW